MTVIQLCISELFTSTCESFLVVSVKGFTSCYESFSVVDVKAFHLHVCEVFSIVY